MGRNTFLSPEHVVTRLGKNHYFEDGQPTLMMSMTSFEQCVGNRFSNGSMLLTSGNFMPVNMGFFWKISLDRDVRFPAISIAD